MSTFSPPLRAFLDGERRVIVLAHIYNETLNNVMFTVSYHEEPDRGRVTTVNANRLTFLPFFWSEIMPRYDLGEDSQDPEGMS